VAFWKDEICSNEHVINITELCRSGGSAQCKATGWEVFPAKEDGIRVQRGQWGPDTLTRMVLKE
jgi:hypothetical protein